MNDAPIVIEYYTDVLCVWAWIAQRRIDELKAQTDLPVVFQHRYIDLFGDTHTKINDQWADKGLFEGYCEHVCDAASHYTSAPIHSDVWRITRPASSANAHLVIKAVELAHGAAASISFAFSVRKAFFMEAMDIANLERLYQLLSQQGIDSTPVKGAVNDGRAIAVLMSDYQRAKQQGIKGSPSYVIDNGRQTLYGNVGYRVLYANIHELLKRPAHEATWC